MKNITREEARKGYMTLEEINAVITKEAHEHGFDVRDDNWALRDGVVEITAENLNCFTKVDMDYTIYDGFVQERYKVSFEAGISRMGGERTPDELRAVANEINAMANLVARLNIIDLEFVKILEMK